MSDQELFITSLSKAKALCAQREICLSEIREKLSLWGLDETGSEKVVETLLRERFIDEIRYANAFVKDKFTYNKWGKYKISGYLRAKKIPEEIINSALGTIDPDAYNKLINDLLINHRRQIKSKNLYDLKAKLLRFGLSRGFESSILYDLLNDIE